MSQAPHPPGRSPPAGIPTRHTSPRPVILPPGPRASRSFVLAAARLRALHLDPLVGRRPHEPAARRRKGSDRPLAPAPVFIERLRDGLRAALSGHPQAVDDTVDACGTYRCFRAAG